MLLTWLKYGIKKGIRYKANTLGWFLADISLYSSTLLLYVLLYAAFDAIGAYTAEELGVYISTYFLVNNLYAVLFAEAVSAYTDAIYSGSFLFCQLNPAGILRSSILLNFNFPALLATPYLVGLNVFFLHRLGAVPPAYLLMYYLSILMACLVMLFFFLCLSTLLLWGIRSSAIHSAINQLFSIAEKPDTVFPAAVRRVFTYIVPAFLFSAVPARILLRRSISGETVFLWGLPVLLYAVYKLLERRGMRCYQQSGF